MKRSRAATGSAAFFAVAPAMVAGTIPYVLTQWRYGETRSPLPVRLAGAVLVVAGGLLLVNAFVRFAVQGWGTPAPIGPTERLVVEGPYRYVRNPMYLAVVAAVLGQGLLLARPVLFAYAGILGLAFVAFEHLYEQPTLARQFGEDYERYRRAVPAWWPRLTPWDAGSGE